MSDRELIAAAQALIDGDRAEAWRYPTVWEPLVARLKMAAQAQVGDEVTVKGFANGGSCAVVGGIAVYGLDVGDKLYTRPQPAQVNQQAIDVIQDCMAMGYLVETVDSSPTHRGLVKRAHKVIESSGATPQSAIAAAQEGK